MHDRDESNPFPSACLGCILLGFRMQSVAMAGVAKELLRALDSSHLHRTLTRS